MFFEKQTEKIYKKIFKRFDENGAVFYFSEKDFPGLQSEAFSFKSSKGCKLQGYFYYYEPKKSDMVIVFDHGIGGGHRSYMREIEKLAANGFTVFAYDHTGCMESEGDGTIGFSQSLSDLNDCLCSLKETPMLKDTKFSVMGHSWGGYACLNISAFHPDVTHVIAMSGFASTDRMCSQAFSGILKPFEKTIKKIEHKANPVFADCDAVKSLKNTDARVLIIHSSDDRSVNYKRHFEYIKNALGDRENTEFLSVSGKNHNPNYTQDALKYKDEFFAALTKKNILRRLKTDGQKKEFISSFDWKRMTDQDNDIWDIILKTLNNTEEKLL